LIQNNPSRERNREHAKRSRIRKKFLLESLQQSVSLLKDENDKLRSSIRSHLGDTQADEVLKDENLADVAAAAGAKNGGSSASYTNNDSTLIASDCNDANKVLDDPDFSFIKALQTAQQNFVVTDPSLPDNPIVYATQGFLDLTGYTLDQVLGRNCRFLQGPETDPKAVEKIRRSIEDGSDMSVCLLNYRVDGTTFWNQFFIAALRDAAGNITNYVGVQCKVSDQYAANVCKKQEEEDARVADGEVVPGGGSAGSGGDSIMGEEGGVTTTTSTAALTGATSNPVPTSFGGAVPTTALTGATSKPVNTLFGGALPTTAFAGGSVAIPGPTGPAPTASPTMFASMTPSPAGAAAPMSMFTDAAPALSPGSGIAPFNHPGAPFSHPGAPNTAPPAMFTSGVTPAPPGSASPLTTMFVGTAAASTASGGVVAAPATHPDAPTTAPPAMFPIGVTPAPPGPATGGGGAMAITTADPAPGEGESS